MTIRLVLVDDHPIVLDGLAGLLALEPDMAVTARCATGTEALRAVAEHRPDVLLLDLCLPDMTGIEVLRRLRDQEISTAVVLLTAALGDEQAAEALRLGVNGILLKELVSRLVVSCIRKVHRGERWLEMGSLSRAVGRLASPVTREAEPAKLSAREREIVRLVVAGLSNKQIAARLHVSEGTVKSHLHHIYEKLEVRTRLQLAAYSNDSRLP